MPAEHAASRNFGFHIDATKSSFSKFDARSRGTDQPRRKLADRGSMADEEKLPVVTELDQQVFQSLDRRIRKKLRALTDFVAHPERFGDDLRSFCRSPERARQYAGDVGENLRHSGRRASHFSSPLVRQRAIVVWKSRSSPGNCDAMTEKIQFHMLITLRALNPRASRPSFPEIFYERNGMRLDDEE